jgi:hypothetical protein
MDHGRMSLSHIIISREEGTDSRPPAISCTQGDIIKIHAFNGLGNNEIGTALHAHGMFFNGTNYYDGAVGVTQCSIPSERGMDYVIDTSLQVSTRKAVGRRPSGYTSLLGLTGVNCRNGEWRADDRLVHIGYMVIT